MLLITLLLTGLACTLIDHTCDNNSYILRTIEYSDTYILGLPLLTFETAFVTKNTDRISFCYSGDRWFNAYTYYGVNIINPASGLKVMLDGMNTDGLSVSANIFRLSNYTSSTKYPQVCWSDVVDYLLSNYNNTPDIVNDFKTDRLTVISDIKLPIFTPENFGLHWYVKDANGDTAVLEYIGDKLCIYEKNVGILTNDPDYQWHMSNINNYYQLSDTYNTDTTIKRVGNGGNLLGMPGDYSSASRFIRSFFTNLYTKRYRMNSPTYSRIDCINDARLLIESTTIALGMEPPPQVKIPTVYATPGYSQIYIIKDIGEKTFYYKNISSLNWNIVTLLKH